MRKIVLYSYALSVFLFRGETKTEEVFSKSFYITTSVIFFTTLGVLSIIIPFINYHFSMIELGIMYLIVAYLAHFAVKPWVYITISNYAVPKYKALGRNWINILIGFLLFAGSFAFYMYAVVTCMGGYNPTS